MDYVPLKTDRSSCLTKKNVLLILMIIQLIMAFLIPKYYLENIWKKKKTKPKHLDLGINNIKPDTIKNAVLQKHGCDDTCFSLHF